MPSELSYAACEKRCIELAQRRADRAAEPPATAERERIAREAAEACWTVTVDRNDKRGLRVAYAEIIRAALDAAAEGGE